MLRAILKTLLKIVLLLRLVQGLPLANEEDLRRLAKTEEILKYVNRSVNPCDDFYEFCCGNYEKYNPTNADNGMVIFSLTKLSKLLNDQKQIILETEDETDTDVDRKVKEFYRSCLNIPERLNAYKAKLRSTIEEFGRMPVLEAASKWPEDNFDWPESVAAIIFKTGVGIIFDISVAMDYTNNSLNSLYLGQPTFQLETKSAYTDKTTAYARDIYVLRIASNLEKLLGVSSEQAAQTAKQIVDFEIALAHGMEDTFSDVDVNETFTLFGLEEVQKAYLPECDLKRLIEAAMGFTPEQVYIEKPYLDNALSVLRNTSKSVVANYLFYNYLSYFMFEEQDNYEKLQRYCLKMTNEHFYKNLDNMIYRKYITAEMKEAIISMWNQIKSAFRNILQSQSLSWMQPATRKHAVDKLNAMDIDVLSYEKTNFTKDFAQLNFTELDYIDNVRSLLALWGSQARAKINEMPQPDDNSAESSFTPTYSFQANSVEIPVIMLQSNHLWSPYYPQANNFAKVGSIISHELVHGFDNNGRQFDAVGNLRDWWDTQSAQEFRKRSTCYMDQYKRYIYGGRPLPEMESQSENIADNGGLHLAYAAYTSWYEKAQNIELESWPGLNYSHKELFFLSYGQLWCANIDPVYRDFLTVYSNHVPSKYRAIGTLSNFDEFSKVFNCSKGSAMNPVEKCEIY